MWNERAQLSSSNEAGFTLMELVVALAIMGILTMVGYGVIALNAATFNLVQTTTVQRWDVRKAMQILRHECQMIDPGQLGAINNGGDKSDNLSFTSVDGDAIAYRRNGSSVLQRKVNSGNWTDLVDNLAVEPFRYLDVNQSPTATKANVAFIEVELNRTEARRNFTLTEQFYVRN